MSVEDTKPRTAQEYELASPCERRYCDDEVFENALVPVSVGNVTEKWCPACIDDEFGIPPQKFESGSSRTTYVNARTAAAFALGVSLTLIVSSMMVV